MGRHEAITLEAVLGLAKQLSAVEKLKLVEHVLVELEPIVEAQKPKDVPKRVVRLGGLWKDIPFDISPEDLRQVRRELFEALKRRAERR